jgi:hypothetical protein
MRRFALFATLAAGVAALVLPATAAAAARPGYEVRPANSELFAALEAGGYRFYVEANDRQRVLLEVDEGLFTWTDYSTHGSVSGKRIDADFGDLGHVDIEVNLAAGQSQRYPPRKGCRGRGSVEVPGTFRGTIEYFGEGDIPPLSVTHGEIDLIRRFKAVCESPLLATGQSREKKGEKHKPKPDLSYLSVSGKGEGRTVDLEAIDFASRKRPAHSFGLLFAGDYERREAVRIARRTLTFFGSESFRVRRRGKQPETVWIKPPEPFAGSALYSHVPGPSPDWTGNLSVDLPGAEVPLVGPAFEAEFCRGPSFAKMGRCLEAQGSGSHSQPLALARLSSLRYLWNSSSSAGSTLYTWSGSGKRRLRTSLP